MTAMLLDASVNGGWSGSSMRLEGAIICILSRGRLQGVMCSKAFISKLLRLFIPVQVSNQGKRCLIAVPLRTLWIGVTCLQVYLGFEVVHFIVTF
mmetsp:Transcript_6834/g.15618  ORF Transcript_6834/g.15618 Transcript_6834/m.15618 type:complete len:95 (+) Transcript_6834:279-563(+)